MEGLAGSARRPAAEQVRVKESSPPRTRLPCTSAPSVPAPLTLRTDWPLLIRHFHPDGFHSVHIHHRTNTSL